MRRLREPCQGVGSGVTRPGAPSWLCPRLMCPCRHKLRSVPEPGLLICQPPAVPQDSWEREPGHAHRVFVGGLGAGQRLQRGWLCLLLLFPPAFFNILASVCLRSWPS